MSVIPTRISSVARFPPKPTIAARAFVRCCRFAEDVRHRRHQATAQEPLDGPAWRFGFRIQSAAGRCAVPSCPPRTDSLERSTSARMGLTRLRKLSSGKCSSPNSAAAAGVARIEKRSRRTKKSRWLCSNVRASCSPSVKKSGENVPPPAAARSFSSASPVGLKSFTPTPMPNVKSVVRRGEEFLDGGQSCAPHPTISFTRARGGLNSVAEQQNELLAGIVLREHVLRQRQRRIKIGARFDLECANFFQKRSAPRFSHEWCKQLRAA